MCSGNNMTGHWTDKSEERPELKAICLESILGPAEAILTG